MGHEEQVEEREVLDSIFPDEITDISPTEYRISIALDIPGETAEPPIMLLTVRYPDAYPDEAPLLDLSAPPNTPPHPLFSVTADKEQLLRGLEGTVEENLGMAMVFTLVSAVKEAAEQLAIERREQAIREREEALLAAEREENKKFHGTPVTPESFRKWREAFLREMEETRLKAEEERAAEMKKARVKEPAKLTGKQLWERGLVGKVNEEDEEDEGVPAEGVERLNIGD